MLTIGLAGGVASGKTYVAMQFACLGARLVNADKLGHEVLEVPEVIRQLTSRFGNQILDQKGQIVRSRVAEIVFGDDDVSKEELTFLEQITHPRIAEKIQKQIEDAAEQKNPALVLDAPLMFKACWDQLCDKIVFVHASREVRLRRAMARGWTEDHFELREQSQTPMDIKRSRATDVIDNHDSKETVQQILELWKKWNLPLLNQNEVTANA